MIEPTPISVTFTVKGLGGQIERNYKGDYYELHSKDWDEQIRDMLDTVHEADEEVNKDHANDNEI